MPNGAPEHDEMPEVILTVARRQNDKQDALLDSHKRQGVIIAGGYLTTGTLTIAAMDLDHAAPAAAIVLIWSLATSLIAGYIQWLAHRWGASPTIAYLIENYYEAGHSREVLELDLAETHEIQYRRNDDTLHKIKKWLLIQAIVAFVGVCLLIGVLLSVS